MTSLLKLQNALSQSLYGMTKDKAVAEGICISCREPALANCYSEAGRREYRISGLCEKCFDDICGESVDVSDKGV